MFRVVLNTDRRLFDNCIAIITFPIQEKRGCFFVLHKLKFSGFNFARLIVKPAKTNFQQEFSIYKSAWANFNLDWKDSKLSRNDSKLSRNDSKLSRNDSKLSRNVSKLGRNVSKLSRNVSKLSRNVSKLSRNVFNLDRNIFDLNWLVVFSEKRGFCSIFFNTNFIYFNRKLI